MTEKEKIEEMAKVLCLFCKEMTEEKECERGKECYDWRLKEASFYYEQGYRKIPEGSVVLTEMQYNALLSKQSTVISIDEQLKKEFEYELKQARKEMVKEILQEILFVECVEGWKENKQLVEFVNKLVDKIEKLAKQHGVEL